MLCVKFIQFVQKSKRYIQKKYIINKEISQSKMNNKKHFKMKIFVFLCTFILTTINLQTKIFHDLNRVDQQQLFLAKQLSNIIKTQKNLKNQTFTCLTILPNNLTKNTKQKLQKLNLSFTFEHNTDKNTKSNIQNSKSQNKQIVGYYQDYDYDKILDLLHGECAIHETTEFLYEYCHKQKVRQFDSMKTKQRMAKQNFEDIAMGYYDYQKVIQNSQASSDQSIKQQSQTFKVKYNQKGELSVLDKLLQTIPDLLQSQKILLKTTLSKQINPNSNNGQKQPQIKVIYQSVPMRSTIYDNNNLFTVDMVNHKQYQLDKENKIIHSNFPLMKTNNYFLIAESIYQVACQYTLNQQKAVYVTKGVMISPFQLAFTGNVSKCDRIIEISKQPATLRSYNTPFYVKKIRAYENYLFGQIEQSCTNNWDWSMNKQSEGFAENRENYIQQGSVLMVAITVNISGSLKTSHHSLNVDKIVAPRVVRVQQNIGEYLQIPKDEKSTSNSWISSCRIISNKPINRIQPTDSNRILNKKLMMVKQSPSSSKKPGDQMLCLCRYQKYVQQFLQMPITLGNKIFQSKSNANGYSYFQYYLKNTVKTYSTTGKSLFDICLAFVCYDYKTNQKPIQTQLNPSQQTATAHKKPITSIQRLTSKNPTFSSLQPSESQKIFYVDIFQNGMVKIHTVSTNGEDRFVYLVTDSSLIKIKLYNNGTREVVNQNSFYQNSTTAARFNYFLGKTLVIYKNYMWRASDKIVFPRMSFINQRITKIERITGVSYIRTWNLDNMKFKKQSYYLTKIDQYMENNFRVKKNPIYQKQLNQQTNSQVKKQAKDQISQGEDTVEQPELMEESKQKIDFSKIDFDNTEYKPLNKSVILRYQYFHGQFCQPINKNRRTDVYLQCGQPWLKIQQVKQTSPCVYQLRVSTKLLCRQDYEKVVQKVDEISRTQSDRIKIAKSTVCYPKNSWDNVEFSYDIDENDILFEGF